MKPDPQAPNDIGRMAQNYEEMHRRSSSNQLSATIVKVGLFVLGAFAAAAAFILISAL